MSRWAIEERFEDFQARFSEASSFNAFEVNEFFNSSVNNESTLLQSKLKSSIVFSYLQAWDIYIQCSVWRFCNSISMTLYRVNMRSSLDL